MLPGGRVRVFGFDSRGHGLQNGHALQSRRQLFQRARCRQAQLPQSVDSRHQRCPISGRHRFDDALHMLTIDRAQHLAHRVFLQAATAKRNGLVGQGHGVAHGATCRTRQQTQSACVKFDVFFAQHMLQVLKHGLCRHGAQVELQTARQHGDRHLLRVGGRQHELQIFRRLFQRLQHRVERGVRQHVHFVDHVDLEAPHDGFVDSLLQQLRDLVHTAVGRRIQLNVVHESACIDISARLTLPARMRRDGPLAIGPGAIQGFGQNPRDRGFAHTSCPGEQIGVVQALLR